MADLQLHFVPQSEFTRLLKSRGSTVQKVQALAQAGRLNVLYMVMSAGSGHIGTSFSAIDLMFWLWLEEMSHPGAGAGEGAEIFFSSKGHDIPALYALLTGLGKLPFAKLHRFRALGGLDGHPDRQLPFMITNTGSLGMGISKARGMVAADRLNGKRRHYYVLTGDGELQEGQIWESLQPTANGKFGEITVIVDHNKIQSDRLVSVTSDLGDLAAKFRAFGWAVARCDGHNLLAVKKALAQLKKNTQRPQVLIADTVKGKGVAFLEQLTTDGFYKFHAGTMEPELYEQAVSELTGKVNTYFTSLGLSSLRLETKIKPAKPSRGKKLIPAYGEELVTLSRRYPTLVVLDGDLIKSCGLVDFQKTFPKRFIECGIAEQDMVSMAGGLALAGKLPVVHSLACFLTPRADEQIYNNATEKTKIIYVGTQAGLIPAGPGHSHQSVRDISILGSIPGLTLLEPANEEETHLALRWAVTKNKQSTYLRLVSAPVEPKYILPPGYQLQSGRGVYLKSGTEAVIIAYGPIMLNEAMNAATLLGEQKMAVAVINLPWLNYLDEAWLAQTLGTYKLVITVDDHYTALGQGQQIAAALATQLRQMPKIINLGLREIPVCGQTAEVLKYHGLDAESLAKIITQTLV